MTEHAVLGASSSDRWMNCPGSIRLSEGMPETSSPYAREGTAAHILAERALRKGLDADVWLGATFIVKAREGDATVDYPIEVTEEMCEAVQVFLDHIGKKVDKAGGGQRFIETTFDLSPLNPPGPMFGTADHVLWVPSEKFLDIDDYKHGVGHSVDVWENSQEMYYALGAVLKLNVRPDNIRVTIVQPRGIHPDGIIRSYEFTWDELVAFKRKLFDRARETQNSNAEIKVGDHCKFCPAAPVCPAQKENAVTLAQAEFAEMPANLPPPPDRLTQEEILLVLDRAHFIEDWIRAIRAYVFEGLERGEKVPGWKLVAKRATRKWTDEGAALVWFKEKGFEEDEAYTRKLLSPAAMEQRVKSVTPRGQKNKVRLPEHAVEAKSSGFNLVPSADPRPDETVAPGEEFPALPPAEEKAAKPKTRKRAKKRKSK